MHGIPEYSLQCVLQAPGIEAMFVSLSTAAEVTMSLERVGAVWVNDARSEDGIGAPAGEANACTE